MWWGEGDRVMMDREHINIRDMVQVHQVFELFLLRIASIIYMRARLSFSTFLGIGLIIYLSHNSVIV